MTKLCPRGKAAAKRKFKVYPSAYANAYASKICAGKIKDPSGVKRKDFKGPKPTSAKEGMMTEIEKEAQKRKDIKTTRDMLMKAREEGGRFSKSDIDIATKQAKKLFDREQGGRESLADKYFNRKMQEKLKKNQGSRTGTTVRRRKGLNVSDVEKLMDAMPKYNVGGHSVMGSPVSVDVDGDTLSNPSASAYYKDLLK
jgi:hypothetical protein